MASWLVAAIAAGGAILGSALTGLIAYRLAELDRKADATGELRTSLAAYGAALDRLTLQIEQLPQSQGIDENWITSLVEKLPTLNWLIGRLSMATVGRGAMGAVDEVIATTNRLVLVAPETILEAMQRGSELIGQFDPSAARWRDEWQEARVNFSAASRRAVTS
jgi:hypothetical protein